MNYGVSKKTPFCPKLKSKTKNNFFLGGGRCRGGWPQAELRQGKRGQMPSLDKGWEARPQAELGKLVGRGEEVKLVFIKPWFVGYL